MTSLRPGSSDGMTHEGLLQRFAMFGSSRETGSTALQRRVHPNPSLQCAQLPRLYQQHPKEVLARERGRSMYKIEQKPIRAALIALNHSKIFLEFLHRYSGDHAPDAPCTAKMLCALRTHILLIELGYDEYWVFLSAEDQRQESQGVLSALIYPLVASPIGMLSTKLSNRFIVIARLKRTFSPRLYGL